MADRYRDRRGGRPGSAGPRNGTGAPPQQGWPPYPPQYPQYPPYPPQGGYGQVPPPPQGGYNQLPPSPRQGPPVNGPQKGDRLRDKIGLPGWGVLLLIPVIILIALYVTTLFIGRPYIVRGASMYPTLHEGDRVFVMNYKFGSTPNRGDVVVLKNIVQQPELLIKRVVAIGGDRLTVENGRLVVNDKYVHKSVNTSVSHPFTELIPDNTVFVMGDNESRSYDSRVFGPVMLNKVVGRAIFIFWPPGDLTKL